MVGRPRMRLRLRNITAGAVLCIALLAAAPAYGQSSAQSGYSQPAGSVQQTLGGNGGNAHTTSVAAKTESNNNKLPFTGLDIALVVAAGGVLLAMGFGIRRISRSELA